MVGDRQGWHVELGCSFDQILRVRGAVKQGKIRMAVKFNIFAHELNREP